jgi:hypothetical protein
MRLTRASFALCLGTLLVLPAGARAQTVLYRQIFANTTPGATANQSFADAGITWQAHVGGTATAQLGPGVTPISNGAGTPNGASSLANVNASGAAGPQGVGFVSTFNFTGGNVQNIIWTNEFITAIAGVGDIRFFQASNAGVAPFRVALQVGGSWFVSQTLTNNNPTASAGALNTLTLATATWQTLNFTPGSALGLPGAATTLPTSGNLTAFGLYADSRSGTSRFDTYEIRSVAASANAPEPASALLVLGAVGVMASRRRRD